MSKTIIITLILAILVICSPYILRIFEQIYLYTFEFGWLRGEKTKEELVVKYIEGLKTGSGQTIEKLLPKTHEIDKEIQKKIEMFQEADFSEVEISFEPTGHLTLSKIKNIRLRSGEIVSEEIFITADCQQYPGIECKKWYLMVGTEKKKSQIPFPVSE